MSVPSKETRGTRESRTVECSEDSRMTAEEDSRMTAEEDDTIARKAATIADMEEVEATTMTEAVEDLSTIGVMTA